ncbi:MAG: Asp-tRNA(Asn)/Glu-tRNA(Gln) amidotransferase GatCAB subunit B [Chloroflexi bacterium HGW-Chloroflexi-1]|nr:MAG: Asp-tRNA(Asn)/Glu-tRNA(Gln) amidotransferase GatCAB subunit B [Chloroflexi bacterium HGW-Chloroflexi-1]
MTHYETIIGLEVHAQLLTESKMFCGCSADYADAAPNTHVCPVCMALPGVLPVINRAAVEKTIMAGLALNCTIAEEAVFARKNYHYADLPKGYQISQYELPFCRDGWIEVEAKVEAEVEAEAEAKRVGITRAHLEEDTGKLVHAGAHSLVDLNRAGVPLLEIVTEPDLRSPEEAHAYLTRLQQILRYLGVSSADMERGAMRCEANVSVRPVGVGEFGTKVEVKNLNSFKAVRQSLEYEVARQIALLEAGERVVQVTMGWDEANGRTVVQRTKESSADYRYFPEPDLPPLVVERAWVDAIAARLPELPDAKAARFVAEMGLDPREVAVLVADRAVANYFEAVVSAVRNPVSSRNRVSKYAPKTVANWITGELFRLMNAAGVGIDAVQITPAAFAELLALVDAGTINVNSARRALDGMFESGRRASDLVAELGLAQVSDAEALAGVVAEVLNRYPAEVASYRDGNEKLFGWLMGQVMRATRGKGNPAVVRELLDRALNVQR